VLRLSDIARVELGAQSLDAAGFYNGSPSTVIGISQSPGSNSVSTAEQVRATLDELAARFPKGIAYDIAFDTTTFVTATIEQVITAVFEAFILVVLVVFIFLGSWRATIIPMVAVPVSLIGAFAVMLALGFSANTVSLFAMVLAIGIVVDDAIVVVENVERIMEAENLPPKEAARKAMTEITGPIVAITLVLLSVFVPVAFIPGITGQLYQQFAVVVSVSMLISAICALTLSPALCSVLLKPKREHRGLMGYVSRGIDRARNGYAWIVARLVRVAALSLIIVAAVGIGIFGLNNIVPTGFLPQEDQGAFFVEVQLPEGASVNRSEAALRQVEDVIAPIEGVANLTSVVGFSFLNGIAQPNSAFIVVLLDPFEQRTAPEESVEAIIAEVQQRAASVRNAQVLPFNLPPIVGLGTTGGFEYQLQALSGQSPEELAATMRALVFAANRAPEVANAFSTYAANTPQIYLDVDRPPGPHLGR
jgi:hydrophobic/amphiphilic exporter-1 (mainly G- bacteria), HAE1 family